MQLRRRQFKTFRRSSRNRVKTAFTQLVNGRDKFHACFMALARETVARRLRKKFEKKKKKNTDVSARALRSLRLMPNVKLFAQAGVISWIRDRWV